MNNDKPDFSLKNSIEEFCQENQYNEEFFHSMQSHFVRNDLQKLILMLELLKEGNNENPVEEIQKMYELCKHSMKKLEIIERIQELKDSDFSNSFESLHLSEIIEEISSSFDLYVMIDYDTINYEIKVNGFFKDLLYEIFSFIKRFKGDKVRISGGRCNKNPNFFVLQLSESKNDPFSQEICERLLTGIETDEWDYLGENIEITLAAMIANYYGGSLKIHSSEEIGNCYSIYIPFTILSK